VPVRHIDTGSDPAMMRALDDTTELTLMSVRCLPSSPAVIQGVDVGSQLMWRARLVPNNSAESAFRMSSPLAGDGPAGSLRRLGRAGGIARGRRVADRAAGGAGR
jgi:hypothetical protein